jgi:hypothetical protein
MGIGFERQNVAGHSAVLSIATPDLFAARPSSLAGRAFAPRQPGIFLEFIDAVERRNVG